MRVRVSIKGSPNQGVRSRSTHHTTPLRLAAILSLEGPVKMAAGMISPTKRTTVTEMRMAYSPGTSSSMKSGSASLAKALSSSSVTRSW